MNLFRANTGLNDSKIFKVNVFKATEMKITLFVVLLFLFLTLINVCFKVLSDLLINILTLRLRVAREDVSCKALLNLK